jgi:uncharacterized protein YndB with AHSA1/START domain
MTPTVDRKPCAHRELTLTRVIDAPCEFVFKAWTDPTQMAEWWGPDGFTNPVCEMDVRPGGALRIVMRAPDGVDYPMTGVFHEVSEPERLVFTAAAEDHEGHALLEWVSTISVAEHGGKTKLTVQENAVALTAVGARMLEGMEPGLTQTLDRLEAHVAQARDRANGSAPIVPQMT